MLILLGVGVLLFQAFAEERGLSIVGEIPRSDDIIRFEDQGKTVIEGDSTLPVSRTFLDLAQKLLDTENS